MGVCDWLPGMEPAPAAEDVDPDAEAPTCVDNSTCASQTFGLPDDENACAFMAILEPDGPGACIGGLNGD